MYVHDACKILISPSAMCIHCRMAFSTVMESMESIGFSGAEIDQILTLLAAVLHMGDIVSDLYLITSDAYCRMRKAK